MWVVEGCICLEGLKLEGPPLSTPSGAGKKFSCWQHAGSVVPGVAREGVALQGQSGAAPAAALCHQAGAGRDVGRLLAQFHPPNFPPWSLRGAVPPTVPLQFFFLKYVDPATYQILGNLKIVTTGLLLRVALNRQLSRLQWMALLLLMTGAATSQINTDCTAGVVQSVLHAPFMVSSAGALLQPCSGSSSPVCAPCWAVGAATAVAAAAASYASVQLCIPVRYAHTHSELPLPLPAAQGYVFGVVSALLSAVAAVYTEWVLKKNNDTLYWQNMLLYGFGSVFNLANLAHRCMPRASTPCCCGCVPALSR